MILDGGAVRVIPTICCIRVSVSSTASMASGGKGCFDFDGAPDACGVSDEEDSSPSPVMRVVFRVGWPHRLACIMNRIMSSVSYDVNAALAGKDKRRLARKSHAAMPMYAAAGTPK